MAESTGEEDNNGGQYKATELWQRIVEEFRRGMPVGKHRQRIKLVDKTFTGSEAIEWLTTYLQSSGMFQTICKGQVVTLLQKFLESDVIEDARGKESTKFNDGSHLYQFVTKPGPLNFLATTPKRMQPQTTHCSAYASPVICISNPYAMQGESRDHHRESCDAAAELEGSHDKESPHDLDKESHDQVVISHPVVTTVNQYEIEYNKIWKDLTLARLLTLVPTLESIPTVNGSTVASNASTSSREHSPLGGSNDIPSWVIMAFKCLSKWPDESSDDVTGGLPIYHGFEHDVFQSISNYFTRQPHPLVPAHLYNLYMSIHYLIREGRDKTATDALQLSSLLIEPGQRLRLHRLLRFIHKTGRNSQLQLSQRIPNKEFMLERFSLSILRPNGRVIVTPDQRSKITNVVCHMIDYYHDIFRTPTDLIQEVQTHLSLLRDGGKRDVPLLTPRYCQRVSSEQYEEQKRSTPQNHLMELLQSIIHDENMSAKVKKHRLKQFKQSYPDIYLQQFPPVPQRRPSSRSTSSSTRRHTHHHTHLRNIEYRNSSFF